MTFEEWWEEFTAEHDEWRYADSQALRRAAFQAGVASRDSEVVSLTNQRDYEYVRAENTEQERDQLRAEINVLREPLVDTLYFLERHSNGWDGINGKHPNEVACTARSALSSIPEQSLAEYRNKVIEECAKRAEAYAYMSQNFNALAEELRAMKEQP